MSEAVKAISAWRATNSSKVAMRDSPTAAAGTVWSASQRRSAQ
jgi:hypothetical protein